MRYRCAPDDPSFTVDDYEDLLAEVTDLKRDVKALEEGLEDTEADLDNTSSALEELLKHLEREKECIQRGRGGCLACQEMRARRVETAWATLRWDGKK